MARLLFFLAASGCLAAISSTEIRFERTSAYHHIRVIDREGFRFLSFDDSMETRMSLQNPQAGHFEYIDYFHMPWLWNPQISNVVMIGLGGGSAQRAFQHQYPDVAIESIEIDPAVVEVASNFFNVKPTRTHQIHASDGRVYLRRTEKKYDVIILDAYVHSRYGSFIPYHLATKEFFELAVQHLTTNGVLAYNVIGTLQGARADILGAMYQTLKSVFPEVYFFPARESQNVVLLATRTNESVTLPILQQRAAALAKQKRISLSLFQARLPSFRAAPPPNAARSPILEDDFAPVDGLLTGSGRRP